MSQFQILDEIFNIIKERQASNDTEASYTAKLFSKGRSKIAQKLGEEAVETIISAIEDDKRNTIYESADLLFHLLVLWADMGIEPASVAQQLRSRKGVSGIEEKKNRKTDC
jgi:phosphoribosyl-ATP pyrophosphohydrolase